MSSASAFFNRRFRDCCDALARGEPARAEQGLRALLREEPENGECQHMLAVTLLAGGRAAEALEAAAAASALQPQSHRWQRTYAQALQQTGRLAEALEAMNRLVEQTPGDTSAWNDLGFCLKQSGEPAAALEAFTQALILDPKNALACNNIGGVLQEQGDLAGAERQYAEALALDPGYVDAASNLGTICYRRGDYSGAVRHLLAALRLDPEHADAVGHLGAVLSPLRHPEAERTLRRAAAMRPDDQEKQLNLGLHLMRVGQFAEGWRHYEARWRAASSGQRLPVYPQPLWTGEPLAGSTLLVHMEQGFGDTFQFLRYLPLLLAQGARLVLQVQPALVAMLRAHAEIYNGQVAVIARGEPQPAFDRHVPLMSLPGLLGTAPATIPPPLRLTPPTRPRERDATLRVGLAWAGNPTHARDGERSLTLATLALLLQTPGVTFVSLQIGPAIAQIAETGLALEQPDVSSWEKTAAVLDTLDVVIAIDSAVAHLAASQGVPVWLLLPLAADWRWELTVPGKDAEPASAWYPGMRLFQQQKMAGRQPQEVAWRPVIERVAAALRALALRRPPG